MNVKIDTRNGFNPDEEMQKLKLAEMAIYGKLLADLLEAVGSPYGIFADQDIRKLYRDLTKRIEELDDVCDEEVKSRYQADLGLFVEVQLPQTIDEMKTDLMDDVSNDFLISSLHEAASLPNLPIPKLRPDQYDFIERVKKCINGVIQWKQRHITAIENSFQNPLKSVPIKVRMQGIDFSFIRNEPLRRLLLDYFEEIAASYEHDLYKAVVVFSRAIVEALVVDALGKIEDEAKIDYAEIRRKNPKDIDFWDMPTLVEVAAKNHILVTDPIVHLCLSQNRYRNTVHVYSQLRDPREITRETAQLAILTLSIAHEDIRNWTQTLPTTDR